MRPTEPVEDRAGQRRSGHECNHAATAAARAYQNVFGEHSLQELRPWHAPARPYGRHGGRRGGRRSRACRRTVIGHWHELSELAAMLRGSSEDPVVLDEVTTRWRNDSTKAP